MQSKARTVSAYLKTLPPDRRAEIAKVRDVVNANLDREGYAEGMSYGMICWVVPHRVFPAGYHCNPQQALPFAALASQKRYCSVYVPLMVPARTGEPDPDDELHRWFVAAWKKAGKKLDMGKCCIRFQRADDLALDVLGELIRRRPAKEYVTEYVAARDALAKRGRKPRAEIRAEAAERKAAMGGHGASQRRKGSHGGARPATTRASGRRAK